MKKRIESHMKSSPAHIVEPRGTGFVTTRWTMLRCAAGNGEGATSAMDTWCRSYWAPVHGYILRRIRDPHLAEDLTQEFFLRWVRHEWLKRPQPELGKFRSFLLTVLRRFLRDELQKAMAEKRSGGINLISIDELADGGPAGPVEVGTFDREWARFILGRAFAALREESDQKRFDLLRPFLERDADPGEYCRLAPHFGGNSNAVGAAVYRLRQRLRQRLRDEILQTVDKADEVDEELTYLLRLIVT